MIFHADVAKNSSSVLTSNLRSSKSGVISCEYGKLFNGGPETCGLPVIRFVEPEHSGNSRFSRFFIIVYIFTVEGSPVIILAYGCPVVPSQRNAERKFLKKGARKCTFSRSKMAKRSGFREKMKLQMVVQK
jgi:hypothetical protein